MVEFQYWLADLQLQGGVSAPPGGLVLGLLLAGLTWVAVRRLLGGARAVAPVVMVAPPVRRGPGLVEVVVAVISLVAALARLAAY